MSCDPVSGLAFEGVASTKMDDIAIVVPCSPMNMLTMSCRHIGLWISSWGYDDEHARFGNDALSLREGDLVASPFRHFKRRSLIRTKPNIAHEISVRELDIDEGTR
jgi:hypothetical protein